ncbi:MAG: response regulator [Chloroflexi bacterium]|nr:response regulator [Chloroflexota bacterium]
MNTRPIEILLAEDNMADAKLTVEGFKDATVKHHITVLSDGQQVMDHLNRERQNPDRLLPDLIILDLNMPKKTGHEVLAELKADDELSMIPVLIFTASDAQADILEAYRLHASAYLTKPIDFGEFTRLVRSIDEFWFNFVKLPAAFIHGY